MKSERELKENKKIIEDLKKQNTQLNAKIEELEKDRSRSKQKSMFEYTSDMHARLKNGSRSKSPNRLENTERRKYYIHIVDSTLTKAFREKTPLRKSLPSFRNTIRKL